jgi:hypothetical protein
VDIPKAAPPKAVAPPKPKVPLNVAKAQKRGKGESLDEMIVFLNELKSRKK